MICVLTHLGPSGMAGHFIAFCKSPVDQNWYCYNDASVSQCGDPRYQNNDEIEGIPYVLFYQKINSNKEIISKKRNINRNYYDYEKQNLNKFSNIKNKDKYTINLYFIYNEKEFSLSFKTYSITPAYLIIKLCQEHDVIPYNSLLFIQIGENMYNIEEYLENNKLKDGDKIIVISNDTDA